MSLNDEPVAGYRVVYDFELNGNGVTAPAISRENPAGFYEHIVNPGDWYVWIQDESGARISVQVPFTIDGNDGNCRQVTIDFNG